MKKEKELERFEQQRVKKLLDLIYDLCDDVVLRDIISHMCFDRFAFLHHRIVKRKTKSYIRAYVRWTILGKAVIVLNEDFFKDTDRTINEQLFITLAHELYHISDGYFGMLRFLFPPWRYAIEWDIDKKSVGLYRKCIKRRGKNAFR